MIEVVLHRLLIKRDEPVDTEAVKTKKALSKSGLEVPSWVQNEIDKQALRENASMDKGKVVAVGATAFKDYGIEAPVKPGDYIIYARFGGKEVTDPETGEVFVIINDEDLIAIIRKEPIDG